MSDSEEFAVQIRTRSNEDDDYQRPAILREEEQDKKDSDASSERDSGSDSSSDDGDDSSDESSADEVEDEDAALLTREIDSQILRTIAAIQSKDPRVYDSNERFFTEEDMEKAQKAWEEKKKEARKAGKEYTLKDYQREVLLEHGGHIKEKDQENQTKVKTYQEEQEELKEAFKSAAAEAGASEDEDDDNLLVKKEKTAEEIEKEEKEYRDFLLENIAKDKAASEAFKDWQNYKDNPNISSDDAFLIDYVLNQGWKSKGKEVDPEAANEEKLLEELDRDKEEEFLDEADRFESKYNFRFEEEGASNIITHARDVDGSMRRKESKRKRERERRKRKKEEERKRKQEEINRARNRKMKEIIDRLKEIQSVTGNEAIGLEDIDLDGDFDFEKYDAQMSKVFDEAYYAAGKADEEKPVWDDDAYDASKYENGEDGDDIMMDADYLPGGEKYEAAKKRASMDSEETAKKEEAKKNAKKTIEELMDQYYSLGFEDVVGGMPVRFKYRKVEKEDFGLTPEEILMADDKELNKYVSIKKLATYRPKELVEKDKKLFKRQKYKRKKELMEHLAQKGFYEQPAKKRKKHDEDEPKKDGSKMENEKKKQKKKEKA